MELKGAAARAVARLGGLAGSRRRGPVGDGGGVCGRLGVRPRLCSSPCPPRCLRGARSTLQTPSRPPRSLRATPDPATAATWSLCLGARQPPLPLTPAGLGEGFVPALAPCASRCAWACRASLAELFDCVACTVAACALDLSLAQQLRCTRGWAVPGEAAGAVNVQGHRHHAASPRPGALCALSDRATSSSSSSWHATQDVWSVAWRGGTLATGSLDQSVRLWKFAPNQGLRFALGFGWEPHVHRRRAHFANAAQPQLCGGER